MSALRDSIKKGLMTLIARKDASVFQNLENFTREINKLGDWQDQPEIMALAAGLVERLPWELQKDGSGMVPGKTVINLAGQLIKKQGITEDLAVWAIEAWSQSLGLKLENTAVNRPEQTKSVPATAARPPQSTAGAAGRPVSTKTSADGTPAYAQLAAKSRLGLIFGQDDSGAIRVFASWFREESAQQCAGLGAAMVKIETKADRPLFSAAPAKRSKTSSANSRSSDEQTTQPKANPAATLDPNAPALVKEVARTKPTAAKVTVAARPAVKTPAPATSSPAVPGGPGKVYYGSAESLYNQAVQLLPGRCSKPDVPEALAILNQAAKQGSIDARRAIGIIYLKGVGIKQDCAAAANWLRLAADGGDAEAQFHLGSLYQCGMGVEFSLEKAQNFLQRAAKQGHKEAEALLKEILQG
ncbi:MAG: hypothetical protein CVV41_04515 [Candidatus Riflebacteria bacterium HGW-Riflebacteria-1]|jgi:hypothetical protein|nr:MAG: hypothetical protein CVV41_04515 [Candidatus Riflebacteria bacterium HGW-Riflebacteria-1]